MPISTVVLRLEGPVQGWGGAGSRWDHRATENRPTKSAVVGLVANALGRTYEDPIDDLAELRFAVRADKPGHVELDYRTAGGGTFPLDARTVQNAEVTMGKAEVIATNGVGRMTRYGAPRGNLDWSASGRGTVMRPQTMLVDAGFLVSLTGETPLVEKIAAALTRPARLLSLGRRANPPAHGLLHTVLGGDRHSDWFHTLALLPTATTTTPQAWAEEFTPHATVSHEQPATGQRRGGPKHGLPLTTRTTTPPAHEEAAA